MFKNKSKHSLFKKIKNEFKARRKRLLKLFRYYVLPLVLLLALYALIFQATSNSFSSEMILIDVPVNASANYVLDFLTSNNLTPAKHNAKLAIRLGRYDRRIHAGLYRLSPNQSLSEIFSILQEKKGVSLTSNKKVVIPEGYTLQEIIDLLAKEKIVSKNAFQIYLRELDRSAWEKVYEFLPSQNTRLENKNYFEGYIFPDTYYFAENSTPAKVLDIFLSNFRRKVVPLFQKENKTGLDLHKLLTLASLVEKEVVVEQERNLIAAIYYKRFKIRMHLGSCPTVKYALGQPHKKYLLYKDLAVDSPYNTYKYLDLPPGPICSPGLASFRAMLNPQDTDLLYFFSKGDGTHVFSKTLREHIKQQNEIRGGKLIY